MENNSFGQRLASLRKERGYSTREFAKAIGIAHSSLFRFETGAQLPNLSIMLDIAAFFNVSLDYLAGLTDRREALK
jgi:transcriptional regulator with XRE-family HTH domain